MDPIPIIVDFPLRGEWAACHTPSEKIPSHGTDQFGQRYAYDFMRIDREQEGWKFCHPSLLRYTLFGVKLNNCYGWSEPIYAPFEGTVVTAHDGWPERNRAYFIRDFAVILKHALVFDPQKTSDFRPVLGNHIILKMAGMDVYAFIAHARTGSIQVHAGDEVRIGQELAKVGHSGNSTAPHLHFHLMDNPNILEAKGLLCGFRTYEALHDGDWIKVVSGIPGKREFIRSAD
jgi:murein DD-endopeptidase MepM/ murein hydrolase activator NlpD